MKPNIPNRGIPPKMPINIISGFMFELFESIFVLIIVSINMETISPVTKMVIGVKYEADFTR